MDIPRIFNITESAHRIHNPFTPEKYATLGAALRLERGTRVLDLGSGSGEMLCTWARDYGVIGTGIDMSRLFTEQAKLRSITPVWAEGSAASTQRTLLRCGGRDRAGACVRAPGPATVAAYRPRRLPLLQFGGRLSWRYLCLRETRRDQTAGLCGVRGYIH